MMPGSGGWSVALCTFNGERFLGEQLRSIREQTRLPDELIVSDDGSTDATEAIVASFAADAPFPVSWHTNKERLGPAHNFGVAISRCRGEFIALADQDDIWHPEKLASMEQVLRCNPSVGAAFSDAELVDAAGRALGRRMWEHLGFGADRQRQMARGEGVELLVRQNVVTGAALAFRARYRDLVLPVPAGVMHDHWIALLLAAVADLQPVTEPLLRYRQHPQQQIGARAKPRASGRAAPSLKRVQPEYWSAQIHRLRAAAERMRLRERDGWRPHPGTLHFLESKAEHLEVRAGLPRPRRRRAAPVLRELLALRYHRYSNGTRSALKDLLL